jgi:aspartokinase
MIVMKFGGTSVESAPAIAARMLMAHGFLRHIFELFDRTAG